MHFTAWTAAKRRYIENENKHAHQTWCTLYTHTHRRWVNTQESNELTKMLFGRILFWFRRYLRRMVSVLLVFNRYLMLWYSMRQVPAIDFLVWWSLISLCSFYDFRFSHCQSNRVFQRNRKKKQMKTIISNDLSLFLKVLRASFFKVWIWKTGKTLWIGMSTEWVEVSN